MIDNGIIDVQKLVRVYKNKNKEDKIAVNNVTFKVRKGEIFSLIGPNGAGKTTIIKILTTILSPSEGVVKILGYNCFGEENIIRNNINFVFGGESGLYWRLTGYENLEYYSTLYNVKSNIAKKRIEDVLELVGLIEVMDLEVEKYSKGMKQRLLIARSLINDPEIIFMDEPTIGLDPIGVKELRNLILNLKKRGKTIFLTSHNMNDVEILSDNIAILKGGKIIKEGTLQEILNTTKLPYSEIKNLENVYLHLIEGEHNA